MENEFCVLAKSAGALLDQTTIPAREAVAFLQLRRWLTDIEEGRLLCIPPSELGADPVLLVDRGKDQ